MRLKDIRGLPVIDQSTAHRLGTIIDYQVDPASSRLAAIDVRAGENADPQRILAERIRRVGRSAVILKPSLDAAPALVASAEDRWLDMATLHGLEVMGDDGKRIGTLADAAFNQDTLEIEAYALRFPAWGNFGAGRGRIGPAAITSCSRELMMVTTGRVPALAAGDDGAADALVLPGIPLKEADRLPGASVAPAADGVATAVKLG